MKWVCNEATWYEHHLGFARDDLHRLDIAYFDGRSSDIARNSSLSLGPSPVWLLTWVLILEDYSRRRLTKASDRLPAISAVAKTLHAQSKDTYLAGLWKSKLRSDLLCVEDPLTVRKPIEWGAPSWS
jgi:hypothetical protein